MSAGGELLFEPVCVHPAAHGKNTFQGRNVLWNGGPAARGQQQLVIIGRHTSRIHHIFLLPVDRLDADTFVQPDIVHRLFVIRHLDQLLPILCAADIVRQLYPVVKRKIFFAKNNDLILLVQCAIGLHESKSARAGPDNDDPFLRLSVFNDTYGGKFKIRLL